MTIYECLGIENFLINETIPTDMIIQNISCETIQIATEKTLKKALKK